jgi:hypothetical protein
MGYITFFFFGLDGVSMIGRLLFLIFCPFFFFFLILANLVVIVVLHL